MSADTLFVFVILALTVALFVSDRLRLDLVALMSLLALFLTGVLSTSEALAGFADPVVIMIAGLFVVSGGLFQTGVADRLGRLLGRVAGTSEARLVTLVMLVSALLSAFMSSTGTVAVMLPVAVTLAHGAGLSPSKLLIPLAFGSLLGGMLTLIGTPPNLVVANQLAAEGLSPFGFFAFTPVGLVMLLVGLAFMLTLGRRLLPERAPVRSRVDELSLEELADSYALPSHLFRLRVPPHSPLVGKSLAEARLREGYGVTVVALGGGRGARSRAVLPDTRFVAGDFVTLGGEPDAVARLMEETGLVRDAEAGMSMLPENLGLVEVLLTPRSRLIGKTVKEVRFRDRYRVSVLSLRRGGEPYPGDPASTPLRFGDTLLVKGPWRHIALLQSERRDFVVLAEPQGSERGRANTPRAPAAIAIMLVMLTLMTLEILPAVIAVLVAAVLMVLVGCLSMDDAYRAINWESVVLIAAILPMATALDKTGGLNLIVDALGGLGGAGPLAVMAALFILTSAFSQVISNTATTVLVAPIAFGLAQNLGVSPYALLMTVAVAASTAFATPIASPVNTLVLGPGQYRFTDFFKVGVLLQLLLLAATLIVVPLLFPL